MTAEQDETGLTWGRTLVLLPLILFLAVAPAKASPHCYASPDRPYELGEHWCKYATYWKVYGRTEVPLHLKANPLWWFGNDFEPTAPSWYLPGNPLRETLWYLRNPLQNMGNYVAGTKDLNYTVRFIKGPPGVTNYADQNQRGCIFTVLDNSHGGNLWWPRTYLSCTDPNVTWYAGTQWSGFYGFKFNLLNAKFQLF